MCLLENHPLTIILSAGVQHHFLSISWILSVPLRVVSISIFMYVIYPHGVHLIIGDKKQRVLEDSSSEFLRCLCLSNSVY